MKSSHCTEDGASERKASLITCCRCAVLSLLGSQLQSPVTPAGYFIADNERLPPQTHLNMSSFLIFSFLFNWFLCRVWCSAENLLFFVIFTQLGVC